MTTKIAGIQQAGRWLIFSMFLLGMAIIPAAAQTPGKSALPVAERVKNLQTQMIGAQQAITVLEGKIPPLNQQVQELIQKVSSVKPPEVAKEEPKEEKLQPRKVEYRPPILVETEKEPIVAFICRENRLFILDIEALNRVEKTITNWNAGMTVNVPAGDFNAIYLETVTVTIPLPGGLLIAKRKRFEAVVKNGHQGEPLENLTRAGSTYQSYLNKTDPQQYYLQFSVYPDSYELFREARKIAWARKFDLNWHPQQVSDKILVGGGGSGVQRGGGG